MKWSGLSAGDRNWAILSFVTSGLSALPLGLVAGAWGYGLGYRLGSGGQEPVDNHYAEMLTTGWFANVMLLSAVLAVISALAWWQFSRNQDEIQPHPELRARRRSRLDLRGCSGLVDSVPWRLGR